MKVSLLRNKIFTFLLVWTLVVANEAIRTIGASKLSASHEDDDENAYEDVQELYVTQRLDHTKLDSTATFEQRYFYSSRYVHSSPLIRSSPDRPTYAFLCMGGEGPDMHKSVLVNSVHCTGDMIELASKLHTERGANVHMFALEHRYYGKSYPTFADGSDPVENKNLVYLSSRQAILDTMHFVLYARKNHLKIDEETVPWVTFGGSYPGMMAALTRYEFPDLIYASVSNSAPLQATLNMYQYNNYVAHILKDTVVGGSDECLNVIQKGHQQLGDIFENHFINGSQKLAQLHQVAKDFNICGGEESLQNLKNVQNFLSESVIDIPMQSNDPSCTEENCNIQKLCNTILQKSQTMEPIQVLADIRASQNKENKCQSIDWNQNIEYWKSTKSAEFNNRSWQWQTCNEFGYYQTCELESHCPFAKGFHPLHPDLEICDKAFDVPKHKVEANVQATLKLYHGWNMHGKRILSVNGDVDPWSTLAITQDHGVNDPKRMPVYMVKGASHHFWTHAPKETDSPEVQEARKVIHQQVITWLNEATE